MKLFSYLQFTCIHIFADNGKSYEHKQNEVFPPFYLMNMIMENYELYVYQINVPLFCINGQLKLINRSYKWMGMENKIESNSLCTYDTLSSFSLFDWQ